LGTPPERAKEEKSGHDLNRMAMPNDPLMRAPPTAHCQQAAMKSLDATSAEQERDCVQRAKQGDAAAFRQLVDRYDRRLLYFVLRFLPDADRALDVLQDVWLTLHRRLSGLRAPEAFRVWLYQIAHDKVIDVLRRDRREAQAYETLYVARNGLADDDRE